MVHKYSLNGYNIALDVNSGCVHVLDDISYDILDYLDENMKEVCPDEIVDKLSDKYSKDDIISSYDELYKLFKEEMLFANDDFLKSAAEKLEEDAPIKAMCLHIAHDCNLRCEYCFASTGDYAEGHRCLMPYEVGKNAIDFLIEKSGNRRNLEVDFFGGEPLMNFEVVKQLVEYGRKREKECNKNFRFTITTNGVLLDEDKIKYLNENMHNVVLSLDGRKEVNDNMRKRIDGTGSYDTIVKKFQDFVSQRGVKDYYVRGTFTRKNLDFSKDLMHMVDLGFKQTSIEPVVTDPNCDYALRKEDLPIIFAEYEKLAKEIIEKRKQGEFFNFFHFMIDLSQGPCVVKRLRGCGSGNEYVAVTPEGDIYPCHQFVGMPEYKMGSVMDKTLDMMIKKTFANANVLNKAKCKDCFAKFYCSGGCTANNLLYGEGLNEPYDMSCELERKRLECAIMIKAALSE